MSDPSSHDTLPSALSSFFESPHHHFLPAAGDDDDNTAILINQHLANEVAAAGPPQSAGASQHEPSPVPTDVDQVPRDDDDAAAAAAVLELAEQQQAEAAEASGITKHDALVRGGSAGGKVGRAYAGRRVDPSPLEITLGSMMAENERLRKMIAVLEQPSVAAETTSAEDAIAEATLRELATAAVGGTPMSGFGFESLQQHLEQHAAQQSQPEQQRHQDQHVLHALGDTVPENETSADDFLHGLVMQISAPSQKATTSDPFLLTRLALEADIARTREAIEAKEVEINALKTLRSEVPMEPESEPQDRAALDAQLSRTLALVETGQRNAGVLRDVAARLQQSHDTLRQAVDEQKNELAVLDVDGDDGGRADGTRALLEVRGYLEGALKMYVQRGQLPPAPLPQLPAFTFPEILQPPPSSLPKKRGRPPRSTQKPSVVPPALAHLVPDSKAVAAREREIPIRRKGVKRGKHELEKEKQREEEEGEMLRSLVGMGVWAKDPAFVEGEL